MSTTEPAIAPAGSAIRLQGVARRFGHRWVLRGVDLEVEPGSVVAMTGRNGSGKTTLLRIVATLLRPTRGTAAVFGHDTVQSPEGIREVVGLLGHNTGLYDDLTAAENLVFSLKMAGRRPDAAEIAARLEQVGLTHVRNERVRGFSAGMRRRLGLARLLLRPPRLLLR
ncbi:MAG TPA: ABC transporter ATP-binding protein, partial [Longimicrobiales bacterium]|nr:ABC transporter ATP-binding protein [Longimicrobiales bacterium]